MPGNAIPLTIRDAQLWLAEKTAARATKSLQAPSRAFYLFAQSVLQVYNRFVHTALSPIDFVGQSNVLSTPMCDIFAGAYLIPDETNPTGGGDSCSAHHDN
jgi:hypothetical protein